MAISESHMESIIREAFSTSKPVVAQSWSTELATEWTLERLLEVSMTLTEPEDVKAAVSICVSLLEFDFHLVERAVTALGRPEAVRLRDVVVDMISAQIRAPQVAAEDMHVPASGRRRTPGGIFARLVKRSEACSEERRRWVFQGNTARQQRLRRDMKRENFALHACTVAKPAQSEIVAKITKQLSVSEISVVERLVVVKGEEFAFRLAREALAVAAEAAPADLARVPAEGGRVRSPGGIFARLIKERNDISDKQKFFIFAVATHGKFRLDTEPEIFKSPLPIPAGPAGVAVAVAGAGVTTGAYGARRFLGEYREEISVSTRIARGLGVDRSAAHVTFIERMVERLGEGLAQEIFEDTRREEKATGGKVGGVLGDLLRKDARVSASDLKFIFGNSEKFPTDSAHHTTCPTSPQISDSMSEISLARRIVRTLGLRDAELATRAVREAGAATAERLLAKTLSIEARGGVIVGSGERRKTPGAVFVELLRSEISSEGISRVLAISDDSDVIFADNSFPAMDEGGCVFSASDAESIIAKRVVVELERLRLSPEDISVFSELLRLRGEEFMRYAYDKTRKFIAKHPGYTPGEVFGAVVKRKLPNDELNVLFRSHRLAQLVLAGVWPVGEGLASGGSEDSQSATEWAVKVGLLGYSAANLGVVERMIEKIGSDKVRSAVSRTCAIEKEGGIMTRDGHRRKTPAGVWISVLKYEGKIGNEIMNHAFAFVNSVRDNSRQDVHYTPSLFTPLNAWREVEKHEAARNIKKIVQPLIETMQHIPVVDPRLSAVIRGGVFLGPKAIDLIDRCVYFLGERKVEELLEAVAGTCGGQARLGEALAEFKRRVQVEDEEMQDWLVNTPCHRLKTDVLAVAQAEAVETEGWTAVMAEKKRKREDTTGYRKNYVCRIFRQTDPRVQTVAKISGALRGVDAATVERAVHRCGEALALDFFRKALETSENFANLIKHSHSIPEADKRYILADSRKNPKYI